MRKHPIAVPALLLAFATSGAVRLSAAPAPPPAAPRADEASAGRAVLERYREAVVTVQLVVAMSVTSGGNSRQNESKTEAMGTVVDPGGLTLISLSSIDPSGFMKIRPAAMPQDFKIDSEVKDARLVLTDGSEVPAEIVLRDKDLDLALLRPREKPAKPFTAVDLARGATPQVLEQVVCLNRLAKVASRAAAVSLERVGAVVERPRPFYVLSTGGSAAVSSPVFNLDGAPVGIVLIRNAAGAADMNLASVLSGPSGLGLMAVVIPAADLLDDVKQALEAKKPAESK